AKSVDGQLVTDGGRVLNSVAVADTLKGALDKAYENASKIKFENSYMRRDIGQRALKAKEVE
ncbi:MAG TPA: phosphoribosylamine--glycine ligase, partial [Ruminococcaceae bacterium]|nr:phosphoribosylamine--glycine ligase [Oscillospiraceae bacterium]